MSEPYRILIPESVDAKISSWELPPNIRAEMESRLRSDLANDPTKHLTPCTAPWGERLNLFAFALPGETEDVKHLFMFHFLYGQDESSLEMVECGYIHQRPI